MSNCEAKALENIFNSVLPERPFLTGQLDVFRLKRLFQRESPKYFAVSNMNNFSESELRI
jgi:hypothetical protein